MLTRTRQHTGALAVLIALIVMVFGATAVMAQDNGRINPDVYMGGASVYCVDVTGAPAASYDNNGGILVLDAEGELLLFVPEAAINAGFAHVDQTGEYATLGVSERLWYGDQPVALYLLASREFQLNIHDEYEKLVEFRWTECRYDRPAPQAPVNLGDANCGPHCRDWSRGTNDGCLPTWDWYEVESRCIHFNLY